MSEKNRNGFQQFLLCVGQSFPLLVQIVKKHKFTLFLILCVWFGWEQLFFYLKANAGTNNLQTILSVIGHAVGSLLIGLLTLFLIPCHMAQAEGWGRAYTFKSFLEDKFLPLISENLRALFRILVSLLLLVIPGIVLWVRYLFVPFVVILHPEYESGRVDPLVASSEIVRGLAWPMFAFTLFDTIFFITTGHLQEELTVLSSPLLCVLLAIASFSFTLWSYSLLYLIYRSRKELITVSSNKGSTQA